MADSRAKLLLLAAALLLLPVLADAAERRSLAGLSLADALAELQTRGLAIVYSSSLVRPEMKVGREPQSIHPRRILDEILAPHGLQVHEGPRGQLVVVPRTGGSARVNAPPALHYLDEVVVTPSHLRLLDEQPESRQFLSREEVEQMPHVADDLYWAVKRLPGASSQDVSAEFNVRGGESDELLVLLDGVELYEPFHLKDFLNVFSILDTSAIGGLDLLTGGFSVEYGGRMSGVMDISTRDPAAGGMSSIVVGAIDASILSSGTSRDGSTQWLVTARGWYPDFLLSRAGEIADEIATDYYDLFGKVTFQLDPRSKVTFGVLTAYDDIGFRSEEIDEVERVDARYRSAQVWTSLQNQWTPALASRTIFAGGDFSRERAGAVVDQEDGSLTVGDKRAFDFLALKQDWTFDIRDRHLLKWGFDVKGQRASYDYARRQEGEETERIEVDYRRKGESYAAYFADRFRLGRSLVAEIGVRWDKQFWIDDRQIAPRVSLMYNLSPQTVIRTAWGRYHQWQQLNELQVEDGVDRFHPGQRAEHWLLSVEHRFPAGIVLRAEGYDKELSELHPRYENLFNPLELFPEAEPDRVRVEPDGGRAAGVEVLLKSNAGADFSWWLGYSLATAEDEIDGEHVPRSRDQRHAVSFAVNRRLAHGWNVNLSGTYHSGWPTTAMILDAEGELVPGPRNRERLPPYHRLDGRVSKAFATRAGAMMLIMEVMNLTGRQNVCCVDDFEVIDSEVVPEYRYWPRVIPSFSLRWRF